MNRLSNIYFDPLTGYIGEEKFYNKVKELGYTRNDVKNFYNSLEVNQRFKKNAKKKIFSNLWKVKHLAERFSFFYHNGKNTMMGKMF